MQVSFRLNIGTRKESETGLYVSYCPALNLYSQGTNEQNALDVLIDGIQLYISSLYERKLYEKILAPNGFVKAANAPTDDSEFVAVLSNYQVKEIDVPVQLKAA